MDERQLWMGDRRGKEKKHGREKNTKRGRLNGGRYLSVKTHGKRVVSTWREGPKKRKDQMGNNSRQDSS